MEFPERNEWSGGRWQKVAPESPLSEGHTAKNGIQNYDGSYRIGS